LFKYSITKFAPDTLSTNLTYKPMKRKCTKLANLAVGAVIMMSLASCYKFGRIAIPSEIAGNAAFEGRITAINNNNDADQTGLSFFAVRVPENWNVTVGENSYVQYAAEGTLDNSDNPVNMSAAMRYSAILSDVLNTSNPKDGYTWFAFQTKEIYTRNINGSANHGCDSVALNYTVINDGVAGTYELDYTLGSYETQNPNVLEEEFANNYDGIMGSDMCRVSTEQMTVGTQTFNSVYPEFKTTITVLEGGTPVDNSPKLSAKQEADGIHIDYANMSGSIEIYKDASLTPTFTKTVSGDQKFNSGNFVAEINEQLEPGTYYVRHSTSDAEATFGIGNKEFSPAGTSVFVLGSTGMLCPDNLQADGDAFELDRVGDANLYDMAPTIVKAMVDSILAVKPAFVLIPGNLTMNGDVASHQYLTDLLKPVKDAGINVYVVPGPKDINNPDACIYNGDAITKLSTITAEDFANVYYKDYGYGNAISRDETTLSYMAYPTDKIALLAIDACQYNNNASTETIDEDGTTTVETEIDTEGVLTQATLDWMNSVIAEAHKSGRQVIALSHHLIAAPFDGYASTGDLINNSQKLDLSALFGGSTEEGTEEGTEPETAAETEEETENTLTEVDTQDFFAGNGIDVVFTGGGSATDIARVQTTLGNNLYQVQTGSAIAYGCPFRLVDITDAGLDIQTRGIRNIPMDGITDGTFENYSYYRTKEQLSVLVSEFTAENWETIDGVLKGYFTFDYDPETDIINKNDFISIPATPEDAAAIVNDNIIPPLVETIVAFVDGNEHLKLSQEIVDGMQRGVDGMIDAINTAPSIVSPIIKEGFATAGLDLDALVQSVTSSIAYNYVGDPTNVTNDLFLNIPFTNYDPTAVFNINAETGTKAVELYNINGVKVNKTGASGIYIKKAADGTVKKVIVK
jgi:hypothetical protein